MKDLYSFDSTVEGAYRAYDDVGIAYRNIFDRIGVPFVVAEADSGNIGGSKSHEYHLISTVGEDTLLTCSDCGYTANEELAIGRLPKHTRSDTVITSINTTDIITKSVTDNLGLSAQSIESTVVSYSGLNATEDGSNKGLAAVFTPKGRSVNLLKVQTQLSKYLKKQQLMSDRATMDMDIVPQPKLDSVDPKDISHLHLFLDDALDTPTTLKSTDKLTVHIPDHFRLAQEGDHCATCQDSVLSSVKAIECAHTFYLGTKYSSVLDCTFREGNKPEKIPAEMGCYGIGVTRILAAVAEAKHDEKGIAWPKAISPYSICIVPTDDRKQEFKEIANQVYDELSKNGFKDDVVIDDRRSGFGAKMKDTELIGYPFTIIIGQKSLDEQDQMVELHKRVQGHDSKKTMISLKGLEKKLFI
jgi:prolyl-tRNA synthetase